MEDLAIKFMQLIKDIVAENKEQILAENKPSLDEDRFLNVQEAAKYIGKSASQIRKMCKILEGKKSPNVRNFGLGLTDSWSIKKSALDNWGDEVAEIKSKQLYIFKPRKKKQPPSGTRKGD